jgi:hypothetical protein
LIVALSASFKSAASASIASAVLLLEFWGFWAGILEFAATGRMLSFFLFEKPPPKIKVTGEKALTATSPALAIMDLGNVSLYELLCQLILSVALSALRLVGHMDGFCENNTANNSPVIAHDKVGLVGCHFGVTAQVDN